MSSGAFFETHEYGRGNIGDCSARNLLYQNKIDLASVNIPEISQLSFTALCILL
jgi:hypothetical protein